MQRILRGGRGGQQSDPERGTAPADAPVSGAARLRQAHDKLAASGAAPALTRVSIAKSEGSNPSSYGTAITAGGGSAHGPAAAAAGDPLGRPSLARSSGGGTGARAPVASGEWVSRSASLKAAGVWGAASSDGGLHHSCIVLPNERLWLAWFLVTLVGSLWTGVFTPYVIAFSTHPGLYPYNDAQAFIEYILFAVFLADIAIRFRLGYLDDTGLIVHPRAIAAHYSRTLLPLDILGIVPLDYILIPAIYGAGPSSATGARLVALLGLLRLARLHRVFSFFRYLDFNLSISLVCVTIVRNLVFVLFITHWAACGLYFIARVHDPSFGSGVFIGRNPEALAGLHSTSERFLVSFYWAVTTFATVGYGDFSPVSVPEIVWTIFYMLFNVALAAYIVGTFTLWIIRRDARTSTYRDRAASLRTWAAVNGLPPKLTRNMEEHLRLAFANEDIADERVLGSMPTSLRRRALRHLYLSTLRRCYLFAGARQRFVDAVLAASHVELLMPGVELVSDGDHVAELFVCVSGSLVQASGPGTGGADEQMPLHDGSVHGGGRVLGEGDAVGEIAFFTDVPHSGSVRTLSVARVLCVPRARYGIVAADFPVGTRAVLENLRQRAQAVVDREFAGDAGAARLAAAPAGLQHMRASAEGSARGGVSKSGLTCAQERALGDALRVKALAAAALARADERRTQEFLSAASRGDATVVRLMLQQGMSPDSCDYDGRVALELAAAAGHGLVIDELLAAACNVNAVDNLGGSALLEAAKGSQDAIVAKLRDAGAVWHLSTVETAAELCAAVFAMNLPLLQRFLKAGARPDAGDYDERTAAHIAACENSLAALKALHEAGADVSLPDRWGSTPLDEAIRVGARPAIDFLVSVGASSLREEARIAEFLAAAARGDCDKLRLMLAHGMAVDAVDYDGRGALVLASKCHIDAVATLLGANADPNLVDCFGGCCLLEAVTARRRDVLALLKAAGARLPWTEGETASRLCTAVGDGDADLLALYLEAGAAPSAGDYDRRCALAIASADGVEAAVRTLLGAGADVNMRDRWNATPLDEAVKAGHDGVAAILVAAGGELGATGCALAGVLCEAVKSGDVALLKRYADAGADLSAFDYDARAALHIAAAEGAAAAVALLLERGADAAAVDRWGATPLAEAKREGRREVVRLLEAAGVRA